MNDDAQTTPFGALTDLTAPPVPAADPAPPAAPLADAPRPRTRWAGIVWGLAFALLALAGIWLATGEGRIDDLVTWVRELSPATAVGYGVVVIGSVLLVTGLVGLLRRAQRGSASRRADS